MRGINLIIFLIFLCKLGLCQSKTLVSGYVKNNNGSPEDFAMVSIISMADSSFLAFGFSDSKGFFTLECSSILSNHSAYATISKLGFKSQKKEVLVTAGINIDLGTIILSTEDFLLQEIIINDKAPSVIIKNDTTVFSASHFTDGTEKKMEDLIKKIPGITVDQNGRIKYQDKNIDRVLLEGDDLLGQDYTIGTKNISSGLVDKVEVIDHYVDNPLFREIINSDKTVINIKVREDFKNDISGTLEAGLGAGDKLKYYGNTYLIALLKKSKSLVFLNSNNIRSQDAGNANYYFENFSSAADLSGFRTDKLAVFNRPVIQANINLPEQYTTTGNLSSSSINHIFRTKCGLKFTASATGLLNEKNNSTEENTAFFNQSDSLKFQDKKLSNQLVMPFKTRLQSEYVSLPRNFSIRTITSLIGSRQKYSYDISRNSTSMIECQTNLKPKGLNNIIEYTKKVKNGLFQFTGDFSFMTQTEKSRFLNPVYTTGILDSIRYQNLQQSVPSHMSQFGLTGRFMYRKSIHTDLDFGYYYKKSTISNQLIQNNESISLYSDTVTRNEKIGYSQLKLAKLYKKSDLAFTVTSSVHSLSSGMDNRAQTFVLFTPGVNFGLNLINSWKLKLTLNIKQNLSDLSQMISGPIFVDYQTLYSGFNEVIKVSQYHASIKLIKKDKQNKYYLNTSMNYNSIRNDLGFGTDFTQNIFKEYTFYPVRKNTTSFMTNGMYLLEKLKSRIEGTLTISNNNSVNEINFFKRNISFKQISFQLKYGSAFSIFNIYCVYEHEVNYIKTSSGNVPNKLIQRNLDIKLTYKPAKSFYCDLKADIFHSQSISKNSFQGYSLKLHYEPNNKLRGNSFECTLSNPFDLRNYSTNYINDFYYYSHNITAVRRFFIFTWSVGF